MPIPELGFQIRMISIKIVLSSKKSRKDYMKILSAAFEIELKYDVVTSPSEDDSLYSTINRIYYGMYSAEIIW